VKNILVGLPPTDQELAAVTADPNALGGLVDGWMKLPEYATKMQRFFELAFQQTQVTGLDFENMLNAGQLQVGTGPYGSLMVQQLQESFARTMVSLTSSGQPFTKAMTTQQHMLSTAMKVFYALTDVWQMDDSLGGIHDSFAKANPTLQIYVTGKTAIPLSQTLDKTNANYMHWYVPGLTCASDPVTFQARSNLLYQVIAGVFPGAQFTNCTTPKTGLLQPSDFTDWTLTNIRAPNTGESTTNFYDLSTLRTATEMVLNRPYVGFFTTPAFFANWQTNMSNQMRVTLNQTLIVATGAQVDGTDATQPSSTPGLDATHASQPACLGCHQTLDPSRSLFASQFSWDYGFGIQNDKNFAGQNGRFVFQGVDQAVNSMADLGAVLSKHPLTAAGWAQKLCYYVDSEVCTQGDPELQKVIDAFTSSNYSWNALVKALVTSPITTHVSSTVTATTSGETVAVTRRDHLCAEWNARLGFADICGLDASQKPPTPGNALAIVAGLPSDGYGRGSVAPVLPNSPSLFFRAGAENFCEAIAVMVIDNKNPPAGAKTWSSAQPTQAIADFVSIVMGLPSSDPRAATASQILTSHFTSAKAASGMTATGALQSTFTAACMSPSAVSMGM
jgi:hypothetical protein